jgi:hypothetical protein
LLEYRDPRPVCYNSLMVKTLEQAIEKLAALPETDQEEIGRKLISHVEKLRFLRREVDEGIRQLDAGEGAPLDIDEIFVEDR